MEKEMKISTRQAIIAIILAFSISIIAQLIAVLAGSGVIALGTGHAIGYVLAALLYPLLTILGLHILSKKVMKTTLAECGITKYKVEPVWIISALLMPVMVIVIIGFTPGHWEKGPVQDAVQIVDLLAQAIFFVGISVGIAEEAVFRGVIMKALELRWNRKVAIIVPSVLFGAVHVIGNKMSFASFLQLVVAGSMVGILFSLVTYESGSIWSGALMHGIWNIFMCSGILNIAKEPMEDTIYNYILETDSTLLSGGEFGIEASVVSIAAYLIFAILAARLMRRRQKK